MYSINRKSAYLIMWIQSSACTTGVNVLVLFFSHLPLDFTCGFISTFACESSTGVTPEAPLEVLNLPCDGQVWRWCSWLGRRVSASTRYSKVLVARAVGNIVLQKGMETSIVQYAPVFLPGEPPL